MSASTYIIVKEWYPCLNEEIKRMCSIDDIYRRIGNRQTVALIDAFENMNDVIGVRTGPNRAAYTAIMNALRLYKTLDECFAYLNVEIRVGIPLEVIHDCIDDGRIGEVIGALDSYNRHIHDNTPGNRDAYTDIMNALLVCNVL
jgi:hypothetical protein